MAIIDTVNI